MRVLSLFSGGGLGDYGLTLAGMEIVGQVEIDEYCQKILSLRWPEVPKWRDIREFSGVPCDLIIGGFPCPAFSRAGKEGGLEQDGLMYEFLRVIKNVRPKWIIAENVEGFTKWKEHFTNEIEALGYEWTDAILDARDFGIPQARRRYFAVCVQRGSLSGSQHLWGLWGVESPGVCGVCADAAHPKRRWTPTVSSKDEWRTIFARGYRSREVDGAPHRMDRLRVCGNGIVVQVVEWLGRQIMKFEEAEGVEK